MTTRNALLALHIAAVAAWLGADFLHYIVGRRLDREPTAIALAWARQEHWLHDRYYAVVAVLVLLTGVGLVQEGNWSWSGDFIWVGFGAIAGGAIIGGGGIGSLAKRRVAELEAGDTAAAAATRKKMVPLQVVVTALPLLALLAMIDRWHA
jgi:hypothetical protein